MSRLLIPILIALLGGVAAGLQAPFSGLMGQRLGDLTSVFFTYCGGAVLIALIVLVSGGANVSEWRTLPWYVFLAGPLGLVVIGTLSYTVPKLGASSSTTLFVLSWLAFSTVIDHYGWIGVEVRSLELQRIIGLAVLMIGTILVVR